MDAADEPVGDSEDGLSALSVTLAGTAGNVTVDDRPRLKSRAQGSLACDRRFEIDGRVRLTCGRGDEKLEVIVRAGQDGERNGLLVHCGTSTLFVP